MYGARCQNQQRAPMLMGKQGVVCYPGHGTALCAGRASRRGTGAMQLKQPV